ncbi:MAG: hypothetical protein ACRDWT_07665 [Jatrophihabitantaceae bacterium]
MVARERDEVDELQEAEDAEQLRRLLITRPGGGHLAASTAVELFAAYHGDGLGAGAVDTALLLCTDWRWRRFSGKVLVGILAVEAMDADELDELAQRLLWPDRVIYTHPAGWFGTKFIQIDITDRSRRPAKRTFYVDPNTPMQSPRSVWPPLRRWSAVRVLSRHLAEPGSVVEHARSLPRAEAAAVITGAVDAVYQLSAAQARAVVDVALGWPHKPTRKLALERLYSWGETERVYAIAARDPDASLRRWAGKLAAEGGRATLFE